METRELTSDDHVLNVPATLGGEDFAFYTERIPGCFVGLGVRNEAQGATHSVHHAKFKVDEDALCLGVALHVAFAIRSLEQLGGTPQQ